MSIALYGQAGFYTHGGGAGRRGDFITSAEVGPLFGVVIARALERWWRQLGEPDDFTVIEVGAGRGTLARAITTAAPAGLAHYVAVEVSASLRAEHPKTVTSLAEMPAEPVVGVVLANELLDNLPFRLAVYDGGWREAFVDIGRDGRPVEVLSAPFDPAPMALPPQAPHGARAPLQDAAGQWVDAARAVLRAGRVVAFDYCTPRTAMLTQDNWRAWLRTYRGHHHGAHYLVDPGDQDITTQVCLDQLPEPDAIRQQAQFLQLWGIDELVEEGREYWRAHASAPSLDALRMRSRIAESEALLDPDGLGAFSVLEWVV